jgi:hypothetical protein
VDEKNDQIAHRRIVAGREILMNYGRNNNSPETPLKRAFAQDQWEVTRAAALDGIFSVSRDEARPYVTATLADKSPLVQRRAKELLALYQEQNNEEKSKK